MKPKAVSRLSIVLIFFSPAIPIGLLFVHFLQNNWWYIGQTFPAFVLGVIAYTYFMNSLILSTRLKVLDRIFGHDRVMRIHAVSAIFSLVSALIHRQINHNHFEAETLQQRFGAIGLIIFVVAALFSILFLIRSPLHRIPLFAQIRSFFEHTLKLDYSIVKLAHNALIFSAIFLALHVLLIFINRPLGSITELAFQVYVFGLGAFAILRWLDFKIFKPLRLGSRKTSVLSVQQLNPRVTEIRMKQSKPIGYKPGQFVFLKFPGSKLGAEEHPFTLSSSPDEGHLSVTVKAVGNYTSQLHQLKKGDKALVDGPYGVFTSQGVEERNLVFIAGGIGITPIFSILKGLVIEKHPSILLIWSVKSGADFIFDAPIRKLAEEHSNIRYVPVISEELPGESDGGLVSAYKLKSINDPVYYFCGPPDMRKSLFTEFRRNSISPKKIKYENFAIG